METPLTRRKFFGMATTAAVAGSAASVTAAANGGRPPTKILGVACSPRRGMTTAKAVQAALDAITTAHQTIQVELIDLGGLHVAGWSPDPMNDDFTGILPKLQDPSVAGMIIGSPCFYRSLSSLCKAFIERCGPLRDAKTLDGKPLGVVTTGGSRNGGQELVIAQIQTAMLSYGMIPVGAQAPTFLGGTLQSIKDDISADETGLASARHTGLRVADIALRFVNARRDS